MSSLLGETYSGIFTGATYASVAMQIRDWIDGNVPNLSMVYSNDDVSPTAKFTEYSVTGTSTKTYQGDIPIGLFTYKGEPIGFKLAVGATKVVSSSATTMTVKNEIHLAASYKIYASGTTSITPHATAVHENNDVAHDYMKCSKLTAGSTLYALGAWYAETEKGGLIIGLYSDDLKREHMDYPVILGNVSNGFLHEELVCAIQINEGGSIVSGALSNSVSESMSVGAAMIVGESAIIASPSSRTKYTVYLDSLKPPTPSATTTKDTIFYAPLNATLSTWCPGFQVDDLFSGTFKSTNHPPVMENLEIDDSGKIYVTVSADGVAVRFDKPEG